MTTSATKAAGCLLKKGTNTIAEVTNISGPGISRETFDVTSHDCTWGEHVAGLPDGGEISIDLNWLPSNTTQTILHNDMTATAQAYALLFSDAATTTWTMTVLVTGMTPAAPVDGALTATATFKLTGAITFA